MEPSLAMPQISFYHLTASTRDEAMPKLLEKVLESGSRAVLIAGDKAEQDHFDNLLWSVGGTRLIPHDISGGEDDSIQPVLISTSEENNNKADFLVITGSKGGDYYNSFDRTLYIFNGNDSSELDFARSRWKELKSKSDLEMKYYFQNDKGNWQEKAV